MDDIEVIRTELKCVQSDCHNKDNRICDNCRLALPSTVIVRAYNNAIKALEGNAELQQMYLTESYEKAKLVGQIKKMNGYLKELFSYYDDNGCDIPTINKARKYLETGVAE